MTPHPPSPWRQKGGFRLRVIAHHSLVRGGREESGDCLCDRRAPARASPWRIRRLLTNLKPPRRSARGTPQSVSVSPSHRASPPISIRAECEYRNDKCRTQKARGRWRSKWSKLARASFEASRASKSLKTVKTAERDPRHHPDRAPCIEIGHFGGPDDLQTASKAVQHTPDTHLSYSFHLGH